MKSLLRAAIFLTASACCVIASKNRFGGSVWLALLMGIAAFSFLWYAYKDFRFSQLKVNSRKTAKAIAFSIVVFAAAWNCYAPHAATGKAYAKVTLSGLAEKSPLSQASEVWVLEIINKGSSYELGKIKTEGTEWEMKDGKLLFNRSESASIDILIEDPVAPSIRFLTHSWSGKVRIQEGKKDTILDLGAAAESYFNYPITDQGAFYQDLPRPLYYHLITLLLALLTTASITIGVVWLPRRSMAVAGAMIWSGLVLFLISDQLTLTRDEKWVLPILTILVGAWAGKGMGEGVISSYSRKQQLGLWLVAAYAAFASAGSTLLLSSPDTTVTVQILANYLLTALWWWVAIIAFLYATDRLKDRILKKGNNHTIQDVKKSGLWWKFFLIPVIVWSTWLLLFYPGILSDDSHVQWAIATGKSPWNDWHPVLHTLFNKSALAIWESPASAVLLQIVFMSAIISRFGCFLYRKGVGKRALYILITGFSLSANNGILMITLWKDVPFAAAVLLLNLVIIRIICNDYQNRSKLIPDLAISLFFATLLRHNGIIIFAFVCAGLLLFAWKQRNKPVFAGLALSVLLIFSFKLLFVNSRHVIPNPPSIKLVPPIKGIASVMKYNGKLPTSASFMETILPYDDWISKYDPYSPDLFMFKTNGVMLNNLDNVPASTVIGTYLECFGYNPRLIIWDKLLGADIAWSVPQPDHGTFRYLTYITPNENGLKSHPWEPGARIAKAWLKVTEKAGITVFWRIGLINILLLVLAIYMSGRNIKYSWIMFLPWLAGVLSLIIASLEQDFRFVYFVFVSFWFQWFFVMTTKKKESNPEE